MNELFEESELYIAAYLDYKSREANSPGFVDMGENSLGQWVWRFADPKAQKERKDQFMQSLAIGSIADYAFSHKRMKKQITRYFPNAKYGNN